MSHDLERIERARSRALVAPGYKGALDELGALESEAWRTHFVRHPRSATSAGRGAVCHTSLADGSQLVLRRFRRGGWLAGVRGDALPSPVRLFEELRANHELARRGAPVPTPVFAVAHRSTAPLARWTHPYHWTGGIATRRISHAIDGLAWLRTRPTDEHLAAGALAAGCAVRRFHDAGGRHADLHIGNLLLRESGSSSDDPQVFVIDLDRASVGSPPSPARRARELARLERSLDKWRRSAVSPPPSDEPDLREAFLRGYAGDEPALERALRSELRRKRWRRSFHRARYRWTAPGASSR